MPLATMTMKTQTLGFPKFYPRITVMGLRSSALRAAKELRYKNAFNKAIRVSELGLDEWVDGLARTHQRNDGGRREVRV